MVSAINQDLDGKAGNTYHSAVGAVAHGPRAEHIARLKPIIADTASGHMLPVHVQVRMGAKCLRVRVIPWAI